MFIKPGAQASEVVPASLVGTYLGVILNSLVPTWAVLLALVGILVAISYMILRTTWQQPAARACQSQTPAKQFLAPSRYAEEEHFSHPAPVNTLAKELGHAKTADISEPAERSQD